MVKLLSISSPYKGALKATYEVVSQNTEAKTTLTQEITLEMTAEKTEATMSITGCAATTPDEALERMTGWLRRLADALEGRKESVKLPL